VTVRRLLYLVAIATATLSARDLAAQTDIVRGKVIGPDSLPVGGVLVAVTSISGNVSRQSRTDRNGNFSITFPNGDGDYMVSFSAMGFSAKRFEVKRTADQEVLLADAKLSRSAVQLDAMKVQQDRNKPNRNDALATDISGSERGLNGGVFSPDQLGDLNAMAGSLPGFTYIPPSGSDPGGFSVFGLDPSQNLTTLNGLPSSSNSLPRDAATSSSVSTSPYDVARGGFSGGSINVRTIGGNNYARRTMSLLGQPPQATWTDAAGRATGAQQMYGSLGGRFAGPIQFNKAFYNFSYQFDNTTHDLQSLLNTDPLALTTAGVAPDSAVRALNLIGLDKIPFRTAGVPDNSLSRRASVFGSFDVTPPSSNVGAAYNLTYNGSYNKNSPSFLSALDLPSRGGDQSNWSAGISGRYNAYFGFGVLNETSLGTSASGSEMNPYLQLPSGSVRVSSDLGGASPVVRNLGFGGNQGRSTSNTLQQSLMNTLSWFSQNNKHRLKMTTELNYSHSSSTSFANQFGTFTYQSLADLAANTPSSFARQLTPRQTTIGNLVGGWSFGDSFRPNQDLQIQYGVRLDGNHFMSLPTSNPLVEQTFGRRNDQVPTPVYFSPRIGFTKTLGTAPDVVAFDGMFRAPRAVLSGGVGMFQNAPNTGYLSQAISSNGLPSGVQQITCIGSATPIPIWNLYMQSPDSAPAVCANGVGASPFISSAPNVSLFAKNYVAPRSIRGNLAWRGVTLGDRLQTTLNGTVSYNVNQSNNYDLNFNPTQQFTLADEGNRPVYAQASNIVPASGLISASDARVSQSYNHVSEIRSDLTSMTDQFQMSVSPYYTWNYNWSWSANYTLQSIRDQQRGFGGNTAGDPRDVAWARSAFDNRHQLGYTFRYLFFGMLNVNWNQSFRSGAPFTPMVGSDINGDGYLNDRAFVFNPATATDTAVRAGMQSLLTSGSGAAKTCLSKQLGTLAARNTCEGPWTSTASLSFSLDPVKTHMPQRARISFSVSNPLAAADLAMHGENNLHGWGQTPFPDNTLLFVRGFDAANKRYIYDVNQRFGSTSLQQTLSRSPVRLLAQVSFDLGPTTERQSLSQQLDRGRSMVGAKYTEQTWKMMYSSGPVLNPLRQILTQADSLELTRVQADSLASLNRWYTIHLDSIWTPIGKYLAELPDHYDHDLAYARYREGRQASVDLLIKIAPTVKSLLTPAQLRKLGFVGPYLDTRYLASVRSSTAGGGFGGGMMGGDIGATMMMSGGGGDRMIIIRDH
jgi:hypothetical protein